MDVPFYYSKGCETIEQYKREDILGKNAPILALLSLIFQSAGIMDSYNAMCYEKFIVDLEIIGMVKRYVEGVQVDPQTLFNHKPYPAIFQKRALSAGCLLTRRGNWGS